VEKIRILYIFAGAGVGGGERYLLLLADKLDKNKYEVLFVSTAKEKFLEEARRRSLEVLIVNMDSKFNFIAFWQIRDFIRKKKITIVHTHGAGASFYGRVAAKWAAVPILVTTVHNSLYDYPISRPKRGIYVFIDRLTARLCDKIICVSDAIKDDLIKKSKLPQEKVLTIHNGIDIESFNKNIDASYLEREFNVKPHDRKIGIVGRLTHQKGHVYFLKAAAELTKAFPDIKCFIVGDGDLKDELMRTAQRLAVSPHCIFTGDRTDIPELLSFFDVFVLSSISEGFPMVLLEAMSAGCPVVASAVGGVPELIQDGIDGILVPAQSHEALSEAITDLLNDKNKRENIRFAARKTVEEKFNADMMIKSVEKLYDSLMEKSFGG
jgi:glycosyltransferase involved in cell wall biosynthesis